jgi:hypothetical protein
MCEGCGEVQSQRSLSAVACLFALIDLDRRINLRDEEEACKVSNGAREDEECHADKEHVSEEQKSRHELDHLELGDEVENAVQIQVQCTRTGRQVTAPPPMVIFGTQLEIHQHDRDLRTRDDQNDEHNEEEAENVVKLKKQRTQGST